MKNSIKRWIKMIGITLIPVIVVFGVNYLFEFDLTIGIRIVLILVLVILEWGIIYTFMMGKDT